MVCRDKEKWIVTVLLQLYSEVIFESKQRGTDIRMGRVLSDASNYYPLVHLINGPNLHSEIACHGQLGKDKYHMIPLICGLK